MLQAEYSSNDFETVDFTTMRYHPSYDATRETNTLYPSVGWSSNVIWISYLFIQRMF